MTKDEFERGYAERSGISVDALRERRHAVRCGPDLGCDDERCEGWAMVPLDWTNHRGIDGLDEAFQPIEANR